ncbi:MAG TPA: aminotransferase class I/II-fold pyridoxal phosphate-dependent enzyme [Methanocorpusculum sp.]|nr:aminotransferase class I/II-fold pyridoxal phosphate-dependent enzyme [Methanocorpusculum sp.]
MCVPIREEKSVTTLPILNFLIDHANKHTVSFHMPGHKGSKIYQRLGYESFLNSIMDCDITEILGADNLFQTEGIIKNTQEEYAKLYGSKRSYLLVNGTSGGVIAAIMATVSKGKKLILARNSHKAIFNTLRFAGIKPIYAYPEVIHEYGISGVVTPKEIERCLKENPDAEAVILPSPNYYGICSDISSIADVVHAWEKILIVDQAHGAHLKFFSDAGCDGIPKSAEEQGADITINSIHKTLASFTQSALLNLNSDRIDSYVLEDKLQMIQSTSPSYLLMASLDINADILKQHGHEIITEWHEALLSFYREAKTIPGLCVIGNPFDDARNINLDITKINLDMSSIGIDAAELEHLLMEHGIFAELTTGNILMCMTGIGNTKSDMDRLLAALKEISERKTKVHTCKKPVNKVFETKLSLFDIPQNKERIPLSAGAGRICAVAIIPYPPGIPLVCPGEMITEEIVDYVHTLRTEGEKVIGVNEHDEITVGKQ